jgi:PAS domain S-box-containing protein
MAVISARFLAVLCLCLITGASAAPQDSAVPAVDFATPQPVIDLGPSLTPERVAEPGDPRGSWFTLTIRNSQSVAMARVLTAFSPPGTGFNSEPLPARPTIVQAVPSDSAIVVERTQAFGPNAFRVLLPPGRTTNLTLHFENATRRHPLLAWTESALIANNRQSAILDGLVWGLLTACALITAGAAILSSRLLAGWAALFLFAVLMADLTASGFLDETALAALSGPYSLFALWIALAVAAAIRVVDYVAPFEAFWRYAVKWRDRVALAVIGVGVVAYAAAPFAGVLVRVIALLAAAAAAGYLSHCGRIGVAAARRLAPAAAIFALVTTAAGCNALGFFGVNLTASAALSGFSAAGAMLVALASTIPAEHSVGRLRDLREIHADSDLQATTTDEAIDKAWKTAAVAASQQGVFDLELDSGTLSLSPEAAVVFGFTAAPTELNAEGWKKRIAPDDWELFRQAMITYRNRPDTPFRVEFRVVTGDRPRWCELRATITGRSDSAEHCLGLIADVTARKTAEPARRPVAEAISG